MSLRLDWCGYEAAKYAVEHWHYSKKMPKSKNVHVGVWEDDVFIGCILFGRGVNRNIGTPYGVGMTEACELVRVALRQHETPVSRIVSIAIRMLKRQSPGVRLLVSYADPEHGHIGGIYQAMGWVYVGTGDMTRELLIKGRRVHKRVASLRYGTNSAELLGATWVVADAKHKYLYPLDTAMREQIKPLAQPYPKRATSIDSDAPCVQQGDGGARPTVALQTSTDDG